MKHVLILSFYDYVQNYVILGITSFWLAVVLIRTCLRFIKIYLKNSICTKMVFLFAFICSTWSTQWISLGIPVVCTFIYPLTQWFYVALCSDIQHKQLSLFEEGECFRNGNKVLYFAILWSIGRFSSWRKHYFYLPLAEVLVMLCNLLPAPTSFKLYQINTDKCLMCY